MKLKNPHDLFFKGTFGNTTVASDFLINYLPESTVKHMDMTTLSLQKDGLLMKNWYSIDEIYENFGF